MCAGVSWCRLRPCEPTLLLECPTTPCPNSLFHAFTIQVCILTLRAKFIADTSTSANQVCMVRWTVQTHIWVRLNTCPDTHCYSNCIKYSNYKNNVARLYSSLLTAPVNGG